MKTEDNNWKPFSSKTLQFTDQYMKKNVQYV